MRLPHEPGASPFASAWHDFRRALSGPIGCLLALILLPIALLALLVLLVVTLWKARKLRRAVQGHVAAQRDASDAVPTALFVRSFAIDPTFTREEATQAAVHAGAGRTAADLLDDALRRGWVESSGDRLAVTARGRDAAEELLRSRGL